MSEPTAATAAPVTTEVRGPVLVVRVDDGKANAITHEMIGAMNAALDQAEGDEAIGSVAIIGRQGKFSAGFDLKVMQAGPEQARDLLRAGAELALRVFVFPKPVVLGCTGHALAMAAILLMAADTRIGAEGPFKIGLNEVAIGMPVPRFAVELARDRLSKRHFVAAVNHARIFDPEGAIDAGYLDQVVSEDNLELTAIGRATEMAESLRATAFRMTRTYMRESLHAELQRGLDEDMKLFALT